MVDSFAKGEALAAIISGHTPENFLSEIYSGTAGGEGEGVGMYDLVCLRVLVTRDSWAVVPAQSTQEDPTMCRSG